MFLFDRHSKSNQQWNDQVADALGTAVFGASQFRQRFRFFGVSRFRQPRKCFVQVANRLVERSFVKAMELLQLGQQVFTVDASATPHLPPANQLINHPHRSVGDPTTAVARIDLLLRPQRRQAAIVRMALDQVFGQEHGRSAQLAVALTNQRAVGVIDCITLVSRRVQSRASVDRPRGCVVLDRPGFPGQPRGRDDVGEEKTAMYELRRRLKRGDSPELL
jgi:hypothetical protein